MSHHHAFYYESEARIRQADKVEQARRWRLAKEAKAGRVQSVRKASLLLNYEAVKATAVPASQKKNGGYAMAEFIGERTIVIAAPVASVYEYVSDFSRHVEWNHQPTEMTKITPGPIGIGSVFRTKERPPRNTPWLMKMIFPLLGKLLGGTGYTEAEITALDPNQRVAWTAIAPKKKAGINAKAEWEINLEPQGEGTQVTQRVHFQLLGAIGERMDPEKLSQQGGEEMANNLAYLKTFLETQSDQSRAASRPAFA